MYVYNNYKNDLYIIYAIEHHRESACGMHSRIEIVTPLNSQILGGIVSLPQDSG